MIPPSGASNLGIAPLNVFHVKHLSGRRVVFRCRAVTALTIEKMEDWVGV